MKHKVGTLAYPKMVMPLGDSSRIFELWGQNEAK